MASYIASSHRVWPLHCGETGALLRIRDWSATSLGDAGQWPERLRAAVDTCLDAAFACFVWWGPELVQIYNDAALPIVQARHPAAFGVPVRDAWADVWPAVGPIVARVMRTGRPVRGATMPLTIPDARLASISLFCSALRDTAGAAAGVLVAAFDATETACAEPAPRYPALLEAMDGYLSPAFDTIYGETCEDVLRGDNLASWPDLIVREDTRTALAGLTRARSGGAITREYPVEEKPVSGIRWGPGTGFPLAKADVSDIARLMVPKSAKADLIVPTSAKADDFIVPTSARADVGADDARHGRRRGVSRDAAGDNAAAERMAMMVAELQHRTRNLIAVVRAIISRTLATSPSPDAFRRRIEDRLRALSRVQGLLSRAEQEPVTIGALLRLEFDEDEIAGRGARRERVGIAGPAVRLRNSIVQTLALALHELAANARKHGALSTLDGRLRIGWRLERRENRSWLLLNWVEETPRRADAPPPRKGYGRAFIEHALSYSHGAETRYALDETGLCCSIALPLNPDASEECRP
jgi:two-component sensor histidine kinase